MLVILVLLVAICVLPAVWAWHDDLAALRRKAAAGSGEQPEGAPPAPPETLEGVLTAQLATGEITRGQYQRAMEKVAAREDERHPLAVPPEQGAAGV
ncbi:hypothetical protein [Paractinoplanes deccanensis]|nr:hypothetical protein [Actinoplanes deccanensis]